MVGLQRQRILEVAGQVRLALPRNPKDQVEVEVIHPSLPQNPHRDPHLVGGRPPLEGLQQAGTEALGAQRHTVHATLDQHLSLGRGDRLGVAFDGQLAGGRQRGQQPAQGRVGQKRRRAAADEHRARRRRPPPQLLDQRVHVAIGHPIRRPGHGDEVAVAAAVCAERHVQVQVLHAQAVFSRLISSTARNASCGISTLPTCFIRFLPSFCFSSSLRLRRDVAAVALGGHVLAHGLDRLAGDDPRADGGLDRRPRTGAAGSARAASRPAPGPAARRCRGGRSARARRPARRGRRMSSFTRSAGAEADQLVVQGAIAARARLELVVEVEHDLRERQLVDELHALARSGTRSVRRCRGAPGHSSMTAPTCSLGRDDGRAHERLSDAR